MNYNIKKISISFLIMLPMLFVHEHAAKNIASVALESNQSMQHHVVHLSINVPPGDFLYADHMMVHIDNPSVSCSAWQSNIKPISRYDKTFRAIKQIYNQPFTLTSEMHVADVPSCDVHLHVSYYQHTRGNFAHEVIPLEITKTASYKQAHNESNEQLASPSVCAAVPKNIALDCKKISWSRYIAQLIESANSPIIQVLLCLMLGILMSLTPCIYPMIPITMGILQAQRSASLMHNFFIALSYSMGVSLTFAALGLFATMTGQLFGALLTNPFIVILLVAFLVYLAFSMMGFYELYIPRFLQPSSTTRAGGSCKAAFLFGVASGTVASPCLSPGLLLLLTLVSTIKNYMLGFLFLFSFGIGLSLPLLIIGTFASSVHILPRAGFWMVEIKRLLGLLIIATCFYFLKNILNVIVLKVLICVTSVVFAFVMFHFAYHARSIWRLLYQGIGIGLIVYAIVVSGTLVHDRWFKKNVRICAMESGIVWNTDFYLAKQQAEQSGKLLFIYFTAPFCTLCSKIETCILSHDDVKDQLNTFVLLKVDSSDETLPIVKQLRDRYAIVGVPTYLLIDVISGMVKGRWGSEWYDTHPQEVAQQLINYER